MTIEVRELEAGSTRLAADALLALRTRFSSAEALVERVDTVLRPGGYLLAGAFVDDSERAAAAMGYRIGENLAWGRFLYVDDLSTLPEHRGHGLARALLEYAASVATEAGCDAVHLDSGTGPERAEAHALYFRSGMRISSHHFSREAHQ